MNVKQEIDRRYSNTHRILRLLKKKRRATNTELQAVGGFRYSARIHELKKEGWLIYPVHVKGGLWDYIFSGHKDEQAKARGRDFLVDDDEPEEREWPDLA